MKNTQTGKSRIVAFNTTTAAIYMDFDTMQRCRYLVDKVAPKEVQWFMTVDRHVEHTDTHGNSKSWQAPTDHYAYYLEGLYIPPQEVQGAEVDTDPMQMFQLMTELKSKHRLVDDQGQDTGPDIEAVNNIVSRMHVWCHSHPFGAMKTGTPSPSGQDERNFRSWVARNAAEELDTPMIMLIFGLGTDVFARVYDPQLPNAYFADVPVKVFRPAHLDFDDIDAQVEAKVVVKTYTATKWSGTGKHGQGRHMGFSTSSSKKPEVTPTKPKKNAAEEREAAAFALFEKHWDHGDFTAFMNTMNLARDNDKEVRAWVKFMDKWLDSPAAWQVFLTACWGNDDALRSLKKPLKVNENPDYPLIYLLHELQSNIVVLGEVAMALTFTKKFLKKQGAKAKKDAVNAYMIKRQAAAAELVMLSFSSDDDVLADHLSPAYVPVGAGSTSTDAKEEQPSGYNAVSSRSL
jgi:hypothetical protein